MKDTEDSASEDQAIDPVTMGKRDPGTGTTGGQIPVHIQEGLPRSVCESLHPSLASIPEERKAAMTLPGSTWPSKQNH
jgi:hypothetical protein